MRNIKIFLDRAKEHSFKESASLLLKALFKADRIDIYMNDLSNDYEKELPIEKTYNIDKGAAEDLKKWKKEYDPTPWELMVDEYDEIDDFFVCKTKDGRLAHISWIYSSKDKNRIMFLKIDEAEIKYSLTFPEFRGESLFPTTLLEIRRYLKKKGYKKLFINVLENNLASKRGISKAGFKKIAKMRLVKIMGIQLSKKYSYSKEIQ
ncbi:hypothetical protein ACFL2O_06160 [Thermodesulfobacteriota bacterium]